MADSAHEEWTLVKSALDSARDLPDGLERETLVRSLEQRLEDYWREEAAATMRLSPHERYLLESFDPPPTIRLD